MALKPQTDPEIDPGSYARDVEQIDEEDENELVIVLERTGTPINEIVVYEEPNGTDHTVDEWNDDYDADDEGVEVVYHESIDLAFEGTWVVDDVMAAYEDGTLTAERSEGGDGITSYTMPASRLAAVGGE